MDEPMKTCEYSSESLYSDTDLSVHLRDKIRTQAQRLRTLEQYRMLCEQRIQELFPSHPIPIKQEHLGLPSSISSDLSLAKQKISRLESQIAQLSSKGLDAETSDYSALSEKFDALLIDKNELEESLRAEMLTCEEQRTYIEVLKQTIEAKSEEFALKKHEESVGKKSEQKVVVEVQRNKTKVDEAKREQARMKNTILDCESQVKRLGAQVKAKESELEALRKDRDKLEEHLTQAAEALQIAEEEVDKLEEEKSALLEYVDEHSSKEQEMEKELNELGGFFEEMKKDFDRAKRQLAEEKRVSESLKIENEVVKEEVFKANQAVKELQGRINTQKSGVEDKDNLIRKLKEDILEYEIKLEGLQASSANLEDTLRDSQSELEKTENQLEELRLKKTSKKETTEKIKSELNAALLENKSLKESFDDIKIQLDSERERLQEVERLRELDIKQLQEFKAKISEYKKKFEEFEEDQEFRKEAEQYRKLDAQKLQSLQNEYQELKQAYKETQQRELLQAETLNSLRQHNSEVSQELEELYREHQELSSALTRKSADFDEIYSKFAELSREMQSMASDKRRNESELKAERANLKSCKDQLSQERGRCEELHKKHLESTETLEKTIKRLKEREEELQSIKSLNKSLEKDLEEASLFRDRLSEELAEANLNLERKDSELEQIQREIVECCKTIASFAGRYTASLSDYRLNISPAYKEFLQDWKDKISSAPRTLQAWISKSIEELDNLSKHSSELSKSIKSSSAAFSKVSSKLDSLTLESSTHKQESLKYKSQLESLTKKCESINISHEKDCNSLKTQLSAVKSELGTLLTENEEIKDKLRKSEAERSELKISAEVNKTMIKAAEDRISFLKSEKTQLEALLAQVQKNIGSVEIGKIYSEITRMRGELEVAEREKVRIEEKLSEIGNGSSEEIRELRQSLLHSERQVKNYQKNIQILIEDANKEEMVQKLRGSERETIKKHQNGSSGSLVFQKGEGNRMRNIYK